MRKLDEMEFNLVSGGYWDFGFDLGIIEGHVSGPESVQEIASGIGSIFSDAYWTARNETADLYAAFASGWAYSASCGQGY